MTTYLRQAAMADCACALSGGVLAAQIRFHGEHYLPAAYLGFTCALPFLWWASVLLAGGYDSRFIGLGSDEFRRLINAAVSLIAGVAIVSYFAKLNLARGYMTVALPSAAGLDLLARYWLRKRLHRLRSRGSCTRRVLAVGHAGAVADLVTTLRREKYHGLSVVATCLAGPAWREQVAGVPVAGHLGCIAEAVGDFGADTVAVLACPEMDGRHLRDWPGSWRRPAPTYASHRPCWTWRAPGPPSARSPACRCCTWIIRSWRAPSRSSRACSTRWSPGRR